MGSGYSVKASPIPGQRYLYAELRTWYDSDAGIGSGACLESG